MMKALQRGMALLTLVGLGLTGCATGPAPLPAEPDAPIDTAGKTERWRTLPPTAADERAELAEIRVFRTSGARNSETLVRPAFSDVARRSADVSGDRAATSR